MKYQRAIYGNNAAQTEVLCCKECGRPHNVKVANIEIGPKGFDCEGVNVPLSIVETDVFRMLAKNFGQVTHRNRMHSQMYSADPSGGPDIKILDVWICKIRKRIKDAGVPLEIKNVWGVGYQLLALNV